MARDQTETGDAELLDLVSQLHTLTEAAQAALTAELEKRKLNGAVEAVPEGSTNKSAAEKLMFGLFICSAIVELFHALCSLSGLC